MNDPVIQKMLHLLSDKKEAAAYAHLQEQYVAVLLKFAFSYVKDEETAKDIVWEVIYKVWANRDRLSQIQHLKIYLFTSVRNSCLRYLYKQKREAQVLDNHVKNLSNVDDDPENLLIASELSECIQQAIERLPPRCKLIFKLIKEEGLRNKDVAAQLGISVNTIDVQLAIAIKRISAAISSFNGRKKFPGK